MFLHYIFNTDGFELVHKWNGIDLLLILECLILAAFFFVSLALIAKIWGKRKLKIAAIIASMFCATTAYAANTALSNLSASGAIAAANLIYVVQTAGVGGVKATFTQVATFINSLFSGDATVAAGGAITFATVNANVGTFGSATTCITTTQNAKGLTTAISAATCTPAVGSITGLGTGVATALAINIGTAGAPVVLNGAGGTPSAITLTNGTGLPIAGITGLGTGVGTWLATPSSANLLAALTTKTGTGNAVFGTAPTITSPTIGTAATLSYITGSTQCLHVDTSGVLTGTGSDCGTASGANPTATAGPTAVNGSAGTFMRSDGAPAIQLGTAAQKGILQVDGTTITVSSGVISTAALTVTTSVQTGANYPIVTGDQSKVTYLNNASAQIPTIAQAGTTGFAAGWFTSACNIGAGSQTITPATSTIGGAATFLLPPGSAAGPKCVTILSDGTNYLVFPAGNTFTIASGTSALGTSAIGSAACASAVTTAGTGILTTDTVLASFNGDPTAVTGYIPLTAGMLTIIAYPTAGNVNFKVCNNTTSSITPGAITLNWRVVR